MKRLLFFLFPVLVISLFLISCNEDDQEHTGFCDAMIIVRTVGPQTLYGLNLHLFSLNPVSSVTATAKEQPSATFELSAFQNLSTEFMYETPVNLFSSGLPQTGDYYFKVKFSNGDTLTYTDNLSKETVLPPGIVKCNFKPAEKEIELEWSKVENASFYNIKLFDSKGVAVFVSPLFVTSYTSYTFGTGTQGWQVTKYPENNSVMTVEVTSYLLESSGELTDYQSAGRSVATVVWGS